MPEETEPVPCASCGGAGGRVETEVEHEGERIVTRQTWRTCHSCNGTGSKN